MLLGLDRNTRRAAGARSQTDGTDTSPRVALVHGERPFGLANREREGEGLIACCRPGDLHAERHYKSGRQVMNAAARYSSSLSFFSRLLEVDVAVRRHRRVCVCCAPVGRPSVLTGILQSPIARAERESTFSPFVILFHFPLFSAPFFCPSFAEREAMLVGLARRALARGTDLERRREGEINHKFSEANK